MEFLVFLFAILIFAIYGFASFCVWLVKPRKDEQRKEPTALDVPNETDDVRGAERILEHLLLTGKIKHSQYRRIRDYLEQEFEGVLQRKRIGESGEKVPVEIILDDEDASVRSAAVPPVEVPVVAALVAAPGPGSERSHDRPVHPLDAPEDSEAVEVLEPAEPRRTVAEMLAGFMEKRNIRWGELASGLLIVGSAVGLVISLREELRDRIPYFSALVFMLITAGIHAVGAYTLKRWKLRNTSRGILLIGMLLIPLNFVAACMLNGAPEQRRSLGDPLLWIAVVTGSVAFSAMSWFSTGNLFRIRHIGIAIAVVVSGLTVLVANRMDGFSSAIVSTWLLAAASFLAWHVAVLTSAPGILKGRYASARFRDRLLTISGIGLFALICVVAMFLIRSEDRLRTLLMLTPLIASVGIGLVFVGDRLSGRTQAVTVKGLRPESARTTNFVGRSTNLIGWTTFLLSVAGSLFHPLVTVATGVVVVVMACAIRGQRRIPGLATAAWVSLAATILIVTAVASNRIESVSWSSFRELVGGLSHSQSGFASMIVAAMALVVSWSWNRRKAASAESRSDTLASSRLSGVIPESLHRFSVAQVCAMVAVVGGLVWMVFASLIHRSDWLDVNAGTFSIGLAAIGGLVLVAVRAVSVSLKYVLVGLLAGAGLHLLHWNQFFSELFLNRSWLGVPVAGYDARAISYAAGGALAVGGCLFVGRNRIVSESHDPLRIFGWLLAAAAVWFSLTVSPLQSTVTIGALIVAAIGCVLLYAVTVPGRSGGFVLMGTQVVMLLVAVGLVANAVVRMGIASSLDTPHHALLQFGVLATVLTVVHKIGLRFAIGDWKWLLRAVAGLFLVWLGIGFGVQCFVELVAGFEGQVSGWMNPRVTLWSLVASCLVLLVAQMFVAESTTPTTDGVLAGLLVVAMVASAAVLFFDSRAVATACRWLVPGGVAVAAVLIGCRKLMPQRWRPALLLGADDAGQQRIINALLSVAVIVVLGISTVAIARFLLVGGGALGGPLKETWLGDMRKDISYGGPVGLIVATFMWFAITERRSFLAMAGSGVFQYVVLLSIVLLFLSPHPNLESTWFLNIMQAISLGMTGYGIVWLWQRGRIGQGAIDFGMTRALSRWKMLDAHAIINVLLVLSMVVLIFQRYFFFPTVSGDWITSAGSFLGIGSAIAVTGFAILLWRNHVSSWMDLFLLLASLACVAFVAAAVDRFQSNRSGYVAWSSFRVLAGGSLLTTAMLVVKTLVRRPAGGAGLLALRTSLPQHRSRYSRIAIGAAIAVSFLFCIAGADADSGGSWVYLTGSGILIMAMACHAYFFCGWFVGFAVLPMVWVFASQLVSTFGSRLDGQPGPTGYEVFLAQLGATGMVAALWIVIDRLSSRLKQMPMGSGFFVMPVLVTVGGVVLAFGTATLALLTVNDIEDFSASGFHWFATIGIGATWVAGFWSPRARSRLFAGILIVASLMTLLICLLPGRVVGDPPMRMALACLAWALTLFAVAVVWARIGNIRAGAQRLRVVGVDRFENAIEGRFPIWMLAVGGVVFVFAAVIVWNIDSRASRMTASFSTLTVAVAAIVFSLRKPVAGIQLFAILAAVAAFVLISISGDGVVHAAASGMTVFLRGLFVPALAVFIFGVFATRWLGAGDWWAVPIRDATAVLTVTTLIGSLVLLLFQYAEFDSELGSGIEVPTAIAWFFILFGIVLGLLTIAVVPKRDPFAFSLERRKGYVYVAQLVCVIAAAHIYLSMPWLLKTGILKYWPYLGIAVSLAGLLVSELLKRRELEVLSEPVYNTAALIPVLVAIGYWLVDSRADASLTFLLAGLIYLGIAIGHRAAWSGAMSMLLGNISLWLFYSVHAIDFSSHPQLWLIPPALCVLLATWFERKWLSPQQLTAIRYACVFTIYLSSTAEVLIDGFGQQLWPPMVLAVLSLIGMAAGIMLQVRSFLFVGAGFLLLAIIAMVSHAQQRLDHVWPWWAFGILMGAGILGVFGFFEKRRNELVSFGKQMRDWDG